MELYIRDPHTKWIKILIRFGFEKRMRIRNHLTGYSIDDFMCMKYLEKDKRACDCVKRRNQEVLKKEQTAKH